eukprot:gene1845-1812_t
MKPIWIVDDDQSIRFVLEKALLREGLPTRSFTNPREVLKALDSEDGQEGPQVLVSDIRMPGGSGLDLLTTIKARLPALPVIIMTAFSDLDSAVSAFQSGAFEYLPKPFDLPKAVELIRRALGESQREEVSEKTQVDTPEMLGQAPAMQDVFRGIGQPKRISDAAIERLSHFQFPGNVRQLENICHWLTVMAPAQVIETKDLPPEVLDVQVPAATVPESMSAQAQSSLAPTAQPMPGAAASASADVSAAWAAAPSSATVSAPVSAPLASGTWEPGLEAEALRLLATERTDVWDVLTRRFETSLIQAALATTRGRRIEAAQKLGIGRNTITRKIQELGIEE